MILETKKIKSDTVSTVSPSISHEVMGNANENHSELSLHKTIEWILESLCIAGCNGSASVEEGMVSS